ncbi:ABC transporter permease [Prolixibacteraceae bacterium JC049]|nr:ABC transporter permease [Prolixibacteraceae bacterium JC049]
MNYIKIATRRLFKKGEHSATRIISLAAGLAFGILLLAEVLYYHSFDSFYPDADRLFVVHENFKMDKSSDKLSSYASTSGAIGPGLKAEVPGVEMATRITHMGTSVFYTEDQKKYKAQFILADEFFFDVMPRSMVEGNAKEILKSPMNCMISTKIASEIGGGVVGKVIELKEYPGKKLTIAGVFEELPENTNYEYDVVVPLISIGKFMWDGSDNWLGNDRYYTCVKLGKGIKPESLAPAVRKMQEKHQDIVKLEEKHGGMVLKYTFKPILKMHSDNLQDIILILSSIAIAVLIVSLMNYILLTLSVLISRAKSSAVHKTCGAQPRNIQQMIFSETAVLFALSLVGALLIVLAVKPLAENELGHSLGAVLNPIVIIPIVGIVIFIMALISYLPARFFSKIPVVSAFRQYKQKKNKWKLALLSFQFAGAAFILTTLVIVTLQYDNLKNSPHGYNTEGVYFGSTSGMSGSKIGTVLHQLRSMPEVEKVGLGACLPIYGASGNNVLSPDKEKELFNVADFYSADENYLSILGVSVQRGEMFSEKAAVRGDVIISQKGAEMLKINNGWTEGVVGKDVTITEHGNTTIRGVYSDFIVGSKANPDSRPSVFFYRPEAAFIKAAQKNSAYSFKIMVKVHSTAQTGVMKKIEKVFNSALPYNDAVIKSLSLEQGKRYTKQRGFRNAMVAGNIVILLITIIGLLGYATNEAIRRKKELAIRQINGAKFSDILRIFLMDLELVAIPAIIVGLVGAWFTVDKWMENFASKIPLHWGIFLGCSLFILVLVAVASTINFTRNANQNPVDALRTE